MGGCPIPWQGLVEGHHARHARIIRDVLWEGQPALHQPGDKGVLGQEEGPLFPFPSERREKALPPNCLQASSKKTTRRVSSNHLSMFKATCSTYLAFPGCRKLPS